MICSEITGSRALYLYGNSGRTYLFDMGAHVCHVQFNLFIKLRKLFDVKNLQSCLDQLLHVVCDGLA